MSKLSRRHLLAMAASGAVLPRHAFAAPAVEITWDDLIPPGVPYSEIIGEGDLDEVNDTWKPVFDNNATRLNPALNGANIKLPGYIIPFDVSAKGVRSFMLVPYVGACIHTPPPPANQLIFVTTETPWPSQDLWEAVWVYGNIRHQLQSYELADVGYSLIADKVEVYTW